MENVDCFEVEVVYALPERQRLIAVRVSPGTTVATAIRLSGILDEFPELNEANLRTGMFSRRVSAGNILRAGDRVEIYRPLQADPKSVRRARALNNGPRRNSK